MERWAQLKWRQKDEPLRQQASRLAQLSAENNSLSNLVVLTGGSSLSDDQFRELLRLRGEIAQLRRTVSEIDEIRAKNQHLLEAQTNKAEQAAAPDPSTVLAYWPKTQLAPAGYGDPASALQTVLWAMSRGDPNALAAGVTPDARSALTREKWFEHGPPAAELATSTKYIADSLSPSSGFYVVGQNMASTNQAILNVYFEGEGKTRSFAMKKIGDEWRFDNLDSGVWP